MQSQGQNTEGFTVQGEYDAESNPFAGVEFANNGAPAVDAFRSCVSDADRLAAMANDMEAEADMTHDLESARILRGAAHKVRQRLRGLRNR